jgi:hypothetical protein
MGYIGEDEETTEVELIPMPDDVPVPEVAPQREPVKVGARDTWT